MKTAIIFGTGIVTGVIATPVAVIFVKPFRHAFCRGVGHIFDWGMRNNPDLRESTLKGFGEIKETMTLLEQEYRNLEGE
jgi:hypothetical protein